jgi:aminoglycoside phosphotransferase (APT) family kinase protein
VHAVDPRAAREVADAVAGWAAARFGGRVQVVGEPTAIGIGFDSYIHRLDLGGPDLPDAWRGPLIVRLLPSPDRAPQAEREATVQRWCGDQGYAVPQVLAVLHPADGLGLPVQVMERAPGTTMLDAFSAKPWRARRLVDQLAALALRLHRLSTADFPADDGATLVDHRLALPRRVVAELDRPELAGALQRAESLAAEAMAGPPVVCHGDFHPLNVMVDGAHAAVIDWTDARLGPREADVARTALLFHIAAIAAGTRLERAVLRAAGPRLARRYLRTYQAGEPLDPRRLRIWEVLHAVHGWAQVEMLHAGGFEGSSSADAGRVPVSVGSFLERRIQRSLEAL